MRIYIVTQGSYSDYHIEAVFSTEELAKAFAEHINTKGGTDTDAGYRGDAVVEDFEVDLPKDAWRGAWTVRIGDDGEPSKCYGSSGERTRPYWDDCAPPTKAPEIVTWRDPPRHFIGYGKTVEHARRSAEELRRQTLALEGKVVS